MSISRPIGVSGHQRTAAAEAPGTTRQIISRTIVPVHGPATKPIIIAARNDSADITANDPPDGTKNSTTKKTRPRTSSRMDQARGVMGGKVKCRSSNDKRTTNDQIRMTNDERPNRILIGHWCLV